MATRSIEDALNSITPEITKILSKDYRTVLDARITILDLSYEALKVNVYRNTSAHLQAFNYAYDTLVQVLSEKATRKYSSLAEIPSGYFDKANAPFLYIDGGNSNRFIVSRTFGAARDFVTKIVSRDPRLSKTSFGQSILYKDELNKNGIPSGSTKKSTRTKVDLGHVPSEENENLVSPLELKFSDILKLGTELRSNVIVETAKKALTELYSIQADASYSFKNSTPESIALARNILGTGYVVVTLHRQKLNAEFSKKELEIFNKLKATLAVKLSKIDFINKTGSNTIVEDIAESIKNTIEGKGKKLPQHKEKKVVPKPINIGVTPNIGKQGILVKKQAPIRNKAGQFYSLSSLQSLINYHLQHVISANMGDGSSKRLLNYRTGRLAASAKVESLTQSREGMITAFYSYMRNPYGTFSEGGKQQSPKTRDPKLLISGSIREIAATKVANRLRAVAL